MTDKVRVATALREERVLDGYSTEEKKALMYLWELHARQKQLPPPGDWTTWIVMAGRGFGKTRVGAEWVRMMVETGRAKRIALVAPTVSDAREVMVEGESGVLAVSPPWNRPAFSPSKRRLTWPNGAIATTYSSDTPERLRGPQHDAAWGDEIGSWHNAETWDMLQFGLRLGKAPRQVVTTTPKPTDIIKRLVKQSTEGDGKVVITKGSTYENRANLPQAFFDGVIHRYEGSRLGRQELDAELLEDVLGALWTRAMFDWPGQREAVAYDEGRPMLRRIVVGVDPAATSGTDSAQTGIVVAGVRGRDEYFVLDDLSVRESPNGWARAVVAAFDRYSADRVIVEVNHGGEMCESLLRTVRADLPITAVRASRGKALRAEPIAALYEQRRVRHVRPFMEMEDQLCNWTPIPASKADARKSPDRLDALVWALTALTKNRGEVEMLDDEFVDYFSQWT